MAGFLKRPKIHIYQAKDGWRWRFKAANGRIIADSGEAYTRQRDAVRAVDSMLDHAATVAIVYGLVVTDEP